MSAVATSRRLRLPRPRPRISRRRLRLAAAAAVLFVLILAGGWFLLRSSSLVAVEHVTITGDKGPDALAVRAALDSVALRMTTLDAQTSRLRAAVSEFPEITGLRITTHFPHGLTIHVTEMLPVAAVKIGSREVPVTGDGSLLEGQSFTGSLPLITLAQPPIGTRLQQRWALAAARLLAAAPRRLLPRLTQAMTVAGHGLVVQVASGPSIYFGDATEPQAKWEAVLAVLAHPGSAGASYIDVSDPARPAAGSGIAVTTAPTGTASGAQDLQPQNPSQADNSQPPQDSGGDNSQPQEASGGG